MLAPAAKYQMRMRVHKPGRNQAAFGVDQLISVFIRLSLADLLDQPVSDKYISVFKKENISLIFPGFGFKAKRCSQKTYVVYQQAHPASSTARRTNALSDAYGMVI